MIVVLGSHGLIGAAVVRELSKRGVPHFSVSRRGQDGLLLDLSDAQTWKVLPPGPGTVLLAVGCGSLKQCLQEPTLTRRVNVEGTVRFAEYASERGWTSVVLSSSYVFDGARPDFRVQDAPCPACEYGRQKVEMEETVLEKNPKVVVVRITKVFDPFPPLVVSWHRSLKEGLRISAAGDARLSPLTSRFVGSALADMVRTPQSGIWHLSPRDELSWADLAKCLADRCSISGDMVNSVPLREIDPSIEFTPAHGSLHDCWPFSLTLPSCSEAVEEILGNICCASEAKCANV